MIPLYPYVIYISVFLFAVALFGFLAWLLGFERREIEQRLKAVDSGGNYHCAVPAILKDDKLSGIPWFNRLLRGMEVSRNLRRLLDAANLTMTVGQLVLLMILSGSFGMFLALRIESMLLAGLFFVLFAAVPLVLVQHIRRKRVRRFEAMFPDAIDIMRNSIRSGYTIVRAIQLVGNEAEEPVGSEFRKTFEVINLGMPFKDALVLMTERIDSIDLKLFITSILVQRESGGNLNEVLFKISDTIRARFKLAGQVRIFTAQGRLTELILGLLPFAFACLMLMINPDYIMILVREPIGHKLIFAALVLQIIGFFIIRHIIRIKIQ